MPGPAPGDYLPTFVPQGLASTWLLVLITLPLQVELGDDYHSLLGELLQLEAVASRSCSASVDGPLLAVGCQAGASHLE